MRQIILRLMLIACAITIFSCKKQNIVPATDPEKSSSNEKDLLANAFQYLKIEPIDPIIIQGGAFDLKNLLDRHKQNTMVFLRDSIWNTGGYSKIYETDEVVVTPDNESYVYPGSILKSASVATGNFAPLKGYTKLPIDIMASFPSDKAIGVINSPSLSQTRVFLRDALMDPYFSGLQLLDFAYSSSSFSSYEESKLAFGYNMNEKKMFSSVNESFNATNSKSTYQTGLIMTYLVKNFTLTMSDPVAGQLIDPASISPDVLEGVSPVYIDQVTYGRFGFLLIETNNNSTLAKATYEKVIKRIFNKSTETFSSEEQTLFNSSKLTVYLLGSQGGAVTQLVNNPGSYEGLSGFISQSLGSFTANDPGVPIQFTMKYLKDNSLFKTTFKVNFPN